MLLALHIALPGCKTSKPESDAADDAKAGSPGTAEDGDDDKIALECKGANGIPQEQAAAIETAARTTVDQLEAGSLDAIWETLHPQAKNEDQKERFMQALKAMQGRLEGTGPQPRVEYLYRVDVSGGVNDMARVFCGGEPGSAEALTMMTNVGDEDLALVTLLSTGQPFGYASTVQLRKRGEQWRLVGIQVNPSSYQGKSAAAFEGLGDQFSRQQKPVAAFLAYGVAQTLAARGTSVSTPDKRRVSEKLAAIQDNQLFEASLGQWKVDGKTFDVHGVSLAATQSDISPVIKYVTPGGLVKDFLEPEADALLGYVKAQFPELQQMFDAVVFEAYAEPPTKPGESYDAYRLARFFEPAQD